MPHSSELPADNSSVLTNRPAIAGGLRLPPDPDDFEGGTFEPQFVQPPWPEHAIPEFPGLDQVVAGATDLQRQFPGPNVMPDKFSPEQQARVATLTKTIRERYPGIPTPTALNLAIQSLDRPLAEADRQARAAQAANPDRGWFRKTMEFLQPAFEVIDKPYQWAVVEPIQSLGKWFGVPDRQAENMSPGQILVAGFLAGGDPDTVWDEDGDIRDPKDWTDGARHVSGFFDLSLRLTADPLVILGKFRHTRTLPFGLNKLTNIERQHGHIAPRVERLMQKATREIERTGNSIPEITLGQGRDLVLGAHPLREFIFGNYNMAETVRALRGNGSFKRFANQVADLADEDPHKAVATMSNILGRARRGLSINNEHLYYIHRAAQLGDTPSARSLIVADAIASLATRSPDPVMWKWATETAEAANTAIAMRNQVHTMLAQQRLIDGPEAVVEQVITTRTPAPPVVSPGRIVEPRVDAIPVAPPARVIVNRKGDTLYGIPKETGAAIADIRNVSRRQLTDNAPNAASKYRRRLNVIEEQWAKLRPTLEREAIDDPFYEQFLNDIDESIERLREYAPGAGTQGRSTTRQMMSVDEALAAGRITAKEADLLRRFRQSEDRIVGGKRVSDMTAAERKAARAKQLPGAERRLTAKQMSAARAIEKRLVRTTSTRAVGPGKYAAAVPTPADTAGYWRNIRDRMDGIEDALRQKYPIPPGANTDELGRLLSDQIDELTTPPPYLNLTLPVQMGSQNLGRYMFDQVDELATPPPYMGLQPDIVEQTVGQVPASAIPDPLTPDSSFATVLDPLELAARKELRERMPELNAKVRETLSALEPYLRVQGLRGQDLYELTHGLITTKIELSPILQNGITDLPAASWGIRHAALGTLGMHKLNESIDRMLDFVPQGELNIHDPQWTEQIRRTSREFGLSDAETIDITERILAAGSAGATRKIVSGWVDENLARMGLSSEEMSKVRTALSARKQDVYATTADGGVTFPISIAQDLNVVDLVDWRMLRTIKSAHQGGIRATSRSIINMADTYQNVLKRLLVAAPRTGIRVLLDNSMRSLAFGFSSTLTNPLFPLIWMTSMVSPETGRKFARAMAGEDIAKMIIAAKDVGGGRIFHDVGMMPSARYRELQQATFKEVAGNPRHVRRYAEDQARWANDIALNDPVLTMAIYDSPEAARNFLFSREAAQYRGTLALPTDPTKEGATEIIDKFFDTQMAVLRQQRLIDSPLADAVRVERRVTPEMIKETNGFAPSIVRAERTSNLTAMQGLNEGLDYMVKRNLASIEFVGRDYTTAKELHREVMERIGQYERRRAAVKPTAAAEAPPSKFLPENKTYIDEGPKVGYEAGEHTVTRQDTAVLVNVDTLLDPARVDLVRTGAHAGRPPQHIEELAESIRTKGFQGHVEVIVEKNGKITITDGTHRIAAAKLAGLTEIPARVSYMGNVQRQGLLDNMDEAIAVSDDVLEVAGKSLPPLDQDVIMGLLQGKTYQGYAAEHALVQSARQTVYDRVKFLMFDMSEHSRLADMFRLFVPFGNAYQEMVTVWGGILMERPWLPKIAASAWYAFDEGGGDLPFLFKHPDTGETFFRVPLSSSVLRFAGFKNPLVDEDNQGWEFTGRLKGMNVMTSGLPIPGPILQIPAYHLMRGKPLFDEVLQVLFPYGAAGWQDSMTPGYMREVKSIVSTFLGSDTSNAEFARILGDLTVEEMFRVMKSASDGEGNFDQSKLATLEDIDEGELIESARLLFILRLGARLFFPSAIHERSPLKDEIENYRAMASVNADWANQAYIARYGPEWKAAIISKTAATKPGLPPPTEKARDLFVNFPEYRKFHEEFGDMAVASTAELVSGPLDSDLIREQLANGDRVRRTLPEIKQAALSAVGWEYYFRYKAQLEKKMNAMGIGSINDKKAKQLGLKADADRFEYMLGQAFPEWRAELDTAGGSSAADIARLSYLQTVPEIQNLEAIKGLKEYFVLRARYIERLQQLGVKSVDAKVALPLKEPYRVAVAGIVNRYPSFSRLWGRYLERDPMKPLNEMVVESGILDRTGKLKPVTLEGV